MGIIESIKDKFGNKAEEQGKAREAILNDSKFVNSLDTNPNVDFESDFETLKKAHEVFKAASATSTELQGLLRNQISADIGINFNGADNKLISAEIDRYMSELSVNDPDRVAQIQKDITRFNEFHKKIEEQKAILEKVGVGVAELRGQRGALNEIVRTEKWLQQFREMSPEHKGAKETAKKDYGLDVDNLQSEFERVQSKLAAGEKAEEELLKLQEKFATLRSSILRDIEPAAFVHKLAQERSFKKFQELGDPTKPKTQTVEGMETARKHLEKMAGDTFNQETGIDYAGPSVDLDAMIKEMDERIEAQFKGDASKAVENLSGSSATFKKMKEGLAPLYKKDQLGDKSSREVRTLLTDYLKDELMPRLPNSKQILLVAVMESMQ